mgnify:CR=1 FL=1
MEYKVNEKVVYNDSICTVIYVDNECVLLDNPSDKNRPKVLVTEDFLSSIKKLNNANKVFIEKTQSLNVSKHIKELFWNALKDNIHPSSTISQGNAWNNINNYFNDSLPGFKEHKQEMWNAGCYSTSNIIIEYVNTLLEKIEDEE